MFDKTSRLAERVASSVSRRGFLDSLGGWAATAALGVAGMLTESGKALAKVHCPGKCCLYSNGATYRVQQCTDCPPSLNGYYLVNCGQNGGAGVPPLGCAC
jgi:hypothetical protein